MIVAKIRILLLLAASAMAAAPAAHCAESKPNIILILADDLGYSDPGCYGGQMVKTPNLDQLAAKGARFTQYYSASPICSPARASIITGCFPARWKITSYLQARKGNRGCEQADFLDAAAPSLPRALKAAGYATAHIGKWHLGGGRDVDNAPKFSAYGYDEHTSTWESPEPDPDITASNWIWSDKDKVKRWERTGYFVDKALAFLKSHGDKPCFINLWFDDTHTPWVPSAGAPKGDTRENFKPVLENVDKQIGRLIDGLRELGIEQNTLLIFTSDNGPLPAFNGERTGEMRGSKLSLFEGGIHVPFIVKWPDHVPQGHVDEQSLLCSIDLLPTLCKIAGAALPDGAKIDGEDKSGVWFGKPAQRQRPLFWEYGRNEQFFSYPKDKHDRSSNVAIRDGQWKLLINADGSGAELYDVANDSKESNEVSKKEKEVTERLSEKALQWRKYLP